MWSLFRRTKLDLYNGHDRKNWVRFMHFQFANSFPGIEVVPLGKPETHSLHTYIKLALFGTRVDFYQWYGENSKNSRSIFMRDWFGFWCSIKWHGHTSLPDVQFLFQYSFYVIFSRIKIFWILLFIVKIINHSVLNGVGFIPKFDLMRSACWW